MPFVSFFLLQDQLFLKNTFQTHYDKGIHLVSYRDARHEGRINDHFWIITLIYQFKGTGTELLIERLDILNIDKLLKKESSLHPPCFGALDRACGTGNFA